MTKKLNILLTGATGFLGGRLAEAFLKEGCEVCILKREQSSLNRIQTILSQLKTISINEDLNFESLFKEQNFNLIVHAATCYGRQGEGVMQITKANLFFPLALLKEAAQFKVPFINIDTVLNPNVNSYSLTKQQFRQWGQYFSDKENLKFINFRLEHFYGSDDDESKFITFLINACLRNQAEIKLSAGLQHRDFIYVDDVVDACLTVIDHLQAMPNAFVDLHVASGEVVKIRDLVEKIHELTNSSSVLNFGALPTRENENEMNLPKNDLLAKLGWQPKCELFNTIAQLISEARGMTSAKNIK